MLLLRRPTLCRIGEFLAGQADARLSYDEVGATRGELPAGWRAVRHRVQIGRGEADYRAATEAVRRWRMFPESLATVFPPGAPLRPDSNVAVLLHGPMVWALVGCRIVYVIDERSDDNRVSRFGFAYGTLPSHIERGEERFTVEWRHDDDTVWYDLTAFSRHGHWLARLGHPVVRSAQRRFVRSSAAAMGGWVESRGKRV